MKKLLLFLIFTVYSVIGFSQANINRVRSYDSTFIITDQAYPDDTLWKFTKDGYLIKYVSNSPFDTVLLRSEGNLISKVDSSEYADTSGYALVSLDSVFYYIKVLDSILYGGIIKFTGQSGTYIDSNKVQSDTGVFNEIISDTSTIIKSKSDTFSIYTLQNAYIYGVSAESEDLIVNNNGSSLNLSSAASSAQVLSYFNIYPEYTGSYPFYQFRKDSLWKSESVSIKNRAIFNKDTNLVKIDTIESVKINVDSFSIGGGDILTSSDTIDLKTAVEAETFEYIQLDTANESYSEGKLFYQKNTNALTFYNDISGFSHQPGYEFVRRVYNGTASTIPNGRAVRKIGTYKNGEIIASVALAGCSDKDSSYVYGIATIDIPAGSEGIVTRGGDVRNLNNPGLNDTIGYLGFAGEIIDTSPEAPNFSVKLCDIIYSDNDSGQVDVNISDPIYYPNPSFDAYFEDSLITITNPGTGVYAKITNALNNALIQDINIGYTFQGDSVSPKQDGKYTVLIAPSFKGDAAQNDLWRIGLFVDNVKYRSISRTSSSTNHGGVPFPVTLDLTAGQWLSFRISNESDGTRDAVLVDLFISITYIP